MFVGVKLVRQMTLLNLMVIFTTKKIMVMKKMSVDPKLEIYQLHLYLKFLATTVKSMDIELKNENQRLNLT